MTIELDFIGYASVVSFGFLVVAMALTFIRLWKGPTLPDRIVALDLIASLSIGIIISLVFFSKELVYLDIAISIALIVFIGTVAISKYLKRKYYDK